MNAIDLYKVWTTFNQMIEDPAFTVQAKQSMGGEMIQSLPPELLCTGSKSSLNILKEAMKSRLTNLGNTNNGSSIETDQKPEATSQVRRGRKRTST